MRESSLHIKESDLKKVLDSLFTSEEGPLKWDTKALAKAIVIGGRKYAATNRNLLVDTQKLAKRAKKIITAVDADVYMFAKALIMHRKQRHHQGIAMIKAGSRDWGYLKEITALAVQFCNEVQMDKAEGFNYYISQCLDKVKKFSLPKLVSLYSAICNEYGATQRIQQDKHRSRTEHAHNFYRKIIAEKIGYSEDYTKQPEKYAAFIDVIKAVDEFGVRIEDYILAQFAGLEWHNGIPDPFQLYGDKAKERLMKYLYTKGLSIKDKSRSQQIDWKKIRKLK